MKSSTWKEIFCIIVFIYPILVSLLLPLKKDVGGYKSRNYWIYTNYHKIETPIVLGTFLIACAFLPMLILVNFPIWAVALSGVMYLIFLFPFALSLYLLGENYMGASFIVFTVWGGSLIGWFILNLVAFPYIIYQKI